MHICLYVLHEKNILDEIVEQQVENQRFVRSFVITLLVLALPLAIGHRGHHKVMQTIGTAIVPIYRDHRFPRTPGGNNAILGRSDNGWVLRSFKSRLFLE